jgi:hypothetical protein
MWLSRPGIVNADFWVGDNHHAETRAVLVLCTFCYWTSVQTVMSLRSGNSHITVVLKQGDS